jgi:hypothetical protein
MINTDGGSSFTPPVFTVPSRPVYAPAPTPVVTYPTYPTQQASSGGVTTTVIASGPVAVEPRTEPRLNTAIVDPSVQSFRGATLPSLSAVRNFASRYVGKGFNRVGSPVLDRQDILRRWRRRVRG